MHAFPFTDKEWDPLKELASSILNAVFAKDDVIAASLKLEMIDRLGTLRARHGDHPVLLETIADYTDDPAERAVLYRHAAEVAEAHGLPTLSIRLAFAPVLVELGQPLAALEELRACGDEAVDGSLDEQEQWLTCLEDVACETKREVLFRKAAEIAKRHKLPVLRIRLLLVRFLLDGGEPMPAREELRSCQREVSEDNEQEWAWWAELLDEADQADPKTAGDPTT